MIVDCHPGQRWISNTEPELGLGIVFEVQDRRVVITFPAGDERRTYASDNAPLTRVVYRVADRVRTADGSEIIVSSVEEIDGCAVYRGVDAQGRNLRLHEIDLDSFVQFNRPLDRLFNGQIDNTARSSLRHDTLNYHHQYQATPAHGLLGPRVQLLPHQVYIAEEVAGRHAPRVLLADEVGLGKTIEAGLIIHKHLINGRANRVLIIVPDNLVHQWMIEMLRRFNLAFSIMSEEICHELEVTGEPNPFETAQLILTNLTFLANSPKRLKQACAVNWDILTVDEAHHLRWEPKCTNVEYATIEQLSKNIPALLLITATPEQLGIEGHFARLRLLDPGRYSNFTKFLEEEKRYIEVNALIEKLSGEPGHISDELKSRVRQFLGSDRVEAILGARLDNASKVITNELLDHHGTSRILFRNCRENTGGFPERRLSRYGLAVASDYLDAIEALAVSDRLTPEVALGDRWLITDPRVSWLNDWLAAHRYEKTLIICAHQQTAESLETYLRVRKGLRSAVFHEGMDLVARDRAATYFADQEENATALICSEIGSEGRNFQFARHLVLFDLPLGPDLLEQRIGRLDRIGQNHAVEIHVPFLQGTAQAVLQRWLHEGIDAFERICPAGPALLEEFSSALTRCMERPDDDIPLSRLIEETRERHSELMEHLRTGRDRLIERNSFNSDRANEILEEIKRAEQTSKLRAYLKAVFDEFGVEHEENSDTSLVLQPGDHMICQEFPGLPEGGLTVTFDRSQALSNDDVHFLTWEHPMTRGTIDMVLGGEFGNASMGTVSARGLTAGTLLIETLFVIVSPAPRAYRIQRFLPQSILRLVVDTAGEDRTASFEPQWLRGNVRDLAPLTAQRVLNKTHAQIAALVDQSSHLAEIKAENVIGQATTSVATELDYEIDRLQQLARANPNVRQKEISYLESHKRNLDKYLRNAQLKLDSVRVVIAT